jgi:hypothetical protein
VFGDESFVIEVAFALGDRFKAGRVSAHRVDELGWSTHGWRLAAAKIRKLCGKERIDV